MEKLILRMLLTLAVLTAWPAYANIGNIIQSPDVRPEKLICPEGFNYVKMPDKNTIFYYKYNPTEPQFFGNFLHTATQDVLDADNGFGDEFLENKGIHGRIEEEYCEGAFLPYKINRFFDDDGKLRHFYYYGPRKTLSQIFDSSGKVIMEFNINYNESGYAVYPWKAFSLPDDRITTSNDETRLEVSTLSGVLLRRIEDRHIKNIDGSETERGVSYNEQIEDNKIHSDYIWTTDGCLKSGYTSVTGPHDYCSSSVVYDTHGQVEKTENLYRFYQAFSKATTKNSTYYAGGIMDVAIRSSEVAQLDKNGQNLPPSSRNYYGAKYANEKVLIALTSTYDPESKSTTITFSELTKDGALELRKKAIQNEKNIEFNSIVFDPETKLPKVLLRINSYDKKTRKKIVNRFSTFFKKHIRFLNKHGGLLNL